MKKWMGFMIFCLFMGVAFVGVKFILQAEQSASKIDATLPNMQTQRIQDVHLPSPVSGSQTWLDAVSDLADAPSSGQDAKIVRGEFAYRAGKPEVHIVLKNEANFLIHGAYISLFLQLNGDKHHVAEALAVPVSWARPLGQGESVRVDVPIDGAEWSAEQVAQAQMRHILVRVVSVETVNENNESMDYPQTSGLVSLKQTENDWRLPHAHADNGLSPDPDYEDASRVVVPETLEEEDELEFIPKKTEPIQEENDVVQQILDEQKVPQHPIGVIFYEEKTLKK